MARVFGKDGDPGPLTVETTTKGKRLGFLGGIEAAYDEQVLNRSQFGLAAALQDAEDENIRRIMSVGGVAPQRLDDDPGNVDFLGFKKQGVFSRAFDPYIDYARQAAADADRNKGERDDPTNVGSFAFTQDKALEELQRKHPDAGILTYKQMFAATRKRAQQYVHASERVSGFLGGAGELVGGAASMFNARVNPLQAAGAGLATTPGGVAARVLAQGVIQGAAEAGTQLLGGQENRALLGLPETNLAVDVAGAAITGALFEGAGEAVAAGVRFAGRKWFGKGDGAIPAPSAPAERAPAREPYTGETLPLDYKAPTYDDPLLKTRVGRARAEADVVGVERSLHDWNGAQPWEIPPVAETRFVPRVDITAPRMLPKAAGETVDEAARRFDPETFRAYDAYVKRMEEIRPAIEAHRELESRAAEASTVIAREIDTQIKNVEARIAKAGKKAKGRLEDELAALKEQRAANVPDVPEVDAVSVQAQRMELVSLQQKVTDLAPAVKRAYARAENKWKVHDGQAEQIDKMLADNAPRLPEMPTYEEFAKQNEIFTAPPKNITDAVPELLRVPDRPDNVPALDVVQKLVDEQLKVLDEASEAYLDTIGRLIKQTDDGESMVLMIDGVEKPVKLSDKMTVPNIDGDGERTISVKDILRELNEDGEAMKAVQTCSIR